MLTTKTKLTQSRNSDSPSYVEQPQNPPAYPYFSSLPSPITAEQFPPSTGHLSYGRLHASTPIATGPVDFCMTPNLGPRLSSGSTHNNHALVSRQQNQYQNQTPHGLLCDWSRDLEPCPVPPSILNTPLSLPPTLQVTHSYSNAGQYDAWMWHTLDGGMDGYASSPDGDTGLSGFIANFEDHAFPLDACADPQPSIALTQNVMPPAQSQSTTFPCNEPICKWDRSIQGFRSFECRWLTDGAPCEISVMADRRSVIEHLQHNHGIKPGAEKARETCLWEQCRTILNKESLGRHILTVHLKEKVHCDDCGLWFARKDSLKRHLKGGQHHVPPEKSVTARQPPSRHHAGF